MFHRKVIIEMGPLTLAAISNLTAAIDALTTSVDADDTTVSTAIDTETARITALTPAAPTA